jgi:Transposase and inactivated derivatives
MRELQTNSHCKNLILYHLIFVCKYRRKCFSNTDFAEKLKLQFFEIAKKYDFEIDTIDLDYSKPDHIHILVRSVPKLSPLQIVRVLKQQTNYWAWQKLWNLPKAVLLESPSSLDKRLFLFNSWQRFSRYSSRIS